LNSTLALSAEREKRMPHHLVGGSDTARAHDR
jgi:hypothetical protein